jgi:deoxyribonuclease-4
VSIEGGIDRAIERALALEATALQVFVGSNRAWRSRELQADEIARFRAGNARCGLGGFSMAHSSYLINLAAPDPALRRRSIAAFTEELRRCALLEIPYLVVHPGAHCGAGLAQGLVRVARSLDAALGRPGPSSRFPGVRVLLEITAGQGTSLCHRFEHVAAIFERARSVERLGVCFDTCHVLAAGYDFRDGDSYRATIAELDRHIGLDRVLGFHLNDSVHPLGSRRDRHAHIGRGEVGLEGFRHILGDRRFRSLPMVLETPKGRGSRLDRRNLSVLRGLVRTAR